VVGRQFNDSAQYETGSFNKHRDIAGFDPHLRLGSARLFEDHCFRARTTMPVDDPELPFRFEDCRDGARQSRLIRNTVEGVGEENVIDRLWHDCIQSHRVGHDKMAIGQPSRSNERTRAIQQVRVDLDSMDAIHNTGERGREQPVSATQINRNRPGLHAHFDKNIPGIGPQRLPPIGIGHRCCRKKTDDLPILTCAQGSASFDRQLHSIILVIDRQMGM
jgi:hypothetical protein